MKRVLIFSLAYFPKHVGGAEVAIKEITDRIPDIEFHMVTNRFDSTLPREERVGNVIVHRIGIATDSPSMNDLRRFPLHLNKFLFQFTAAWTGLALHRRYHFDGIWAMMAHSSGVPAAIFKLIHPQVPYVLTLQEGDSPEHIEKVMKPLWPLFTRAFTSADIVTAISVFLGKWARRREFGGVLEIIPNGADIAHFGGDTAEAEIAAAEKAIGRVDDDIFLVTTSRLVYKNAVDDVIRALPMLPENIKFAVLGVGPDDAMLHALAAELGVTSRVRFLGHVPHADLPAYLKACDIFIRASRSEGMGASFIEAFAAGLPVIATQEGGIADFLFDEKRDRIHPPTGWAVDRDAPPQIAQAVRDVMADYSKTEAVIERARALAQEQYDWESIARSMREKVFDKVIKNG